MRSRARIGAWCLGALIAVLAVSAPAGAASKRITGNLSKPGYTVIALAQNGKAKAVRLGQRRFTLAPPGRRVTLHLRTPNGAYGGPIVVGRKGRFAIVGVRAGARLGRVRVHRGYGRVARPLSARSVDANRKARAIKGVPIGAKRFGRVRSKLPRAGAPGDRDLDGIPDVFDIDDDGDLVLDNLDRAGAAAVAATAGAAQAPAELFDVLTSLSLELERTANANAAPPGSLLTTGQIDTALAGSGRLLMKIMPGDSPELDCGGLVYCSTGGTRQDLQGRRHDAVSKLLRHRGSAGRPRRADTRPGFAAAPATPFFFLGHGAGTARIGTGDLLIQRVSRGGVETEFPPRFSSCSPRSRRWRRTATRRGTPRPCPTRSPRAARAPWATGFPWRQGLTGTWS